MKDTNYLNFSLRERFWLNTKVFDVQTLQATEPGQTIRLAVDPFAALISTSQSITTGEIRHYASQLALTLARFREFRYVGTKVAVVPAATSVNVDPAHISASLAGQSNYMHPRDTNNMLHWRRWLGGNIRVPSVRPTGASGTTYTINDAYDLDAAWMSDVRYNHVPISQGFEVFVAPKRATLQIGAGSMVSVLGIWSERSMAGKQHGADDYWQSYGQTALSTGEIVNDGWVPNPFAGFQYDWIDDAQSGVWPQTGNEIPYVVGFNPLFPWFGDVMDLSKVADKPTLVALINLVRERFLAPICILRLPPAYGSSYYFTVYMRHFFSVRKPYLVNGVWVAAKVQRFTPSPVTTNGLRMLTEVEDVDDDYRITQSISPDPYAGGDDTSVLSMDDLCSDSIWCMNPFDSEEPVDDEEEKKEEEKKEEEKKEDDGREL